MNHARLRVVRAALLPPLLLVVLLALLRPASPGPAPADSAPPPGEPPRLRPGYAETFAFLTEGRADPGTGRGLFETDFFKPPPPPPPPPPAPKPPPPPPKRVAASYRGFASFGSGAPSVAYLVVDGRVRTLAPGDAVAEGWKLLSFDDAAAELGHDDARLRLPFNQPVSLPAPPSP